MELRQFLSQTIKKASIPGQGVFTRDLYDLYATHRLSVESPEITPSFLSFIKQLREMGYRVDRNKSKHRHGQSKVFDVIAI